MKKFQISTISKRTSYWAILLIWLIFISINTYGAPSGMDIGIKFLWSFVNSVYYFLFVWVNINWLLPYFLKNKSPLIYIASVMGIALCLTPMELLSNKLFSYLYDVEFDKLALDSKFHFFSFIIVIATSSLIKITMDWFRIQNEKSDLQTKNMQSELQFLKNQINPHFLFNTMNNLYALTLKKSDSAPEVVIKLSDMLRYMLYECNEKEVAIEKELRYINNYIELEKFRLSKTADIQVNIHGDIHNTKIAPLLIIPFIENGFKHGLKNNVLTPFLHINVNCTSEEINIFIENSKPQFYAGLMKPKEIGGIGLVNVRKRLELIYPNKHELSIHNEPERFQVILKIKQK